MPIPFIGALGIRPIITGIAVAAVGVIILLGYKTYTDLQRTVTVLTADRAVLGGAVSIQQDTIEEQRSAIADWKQSQEELLVAVFELQRNAVEAAEETERLNDLFAEHNLTRLARRKPGLIERRINTGTSDALRMLECASGAERPDCPDPGGPADRTTPAP